MEVSALLNVLTASIEGKQIAAHLDAVEQSLPSCVKSVYARADSGIPTDRSSSVGWDSGFCCREATEAYEKKGWQYIVVARKTARLIDELQTAEWQPSPKTDADQQCEFLYQPDGWSKPHRFLALRYERAEEDAKPEQYQLFDTSQSIYRAFVTGLDSPIEPAVWFYNQRASA
jgi:hypothetical protein